LAAVPEPFHHAGIRFLYGGVDERVARFEPRLQTLNGGKDGAIKKVFGERAYGVAGGDGDLRPRVGDYALLTHDGDDRGSRAGPHPKLPDGLSGQWAVLWQLDPVRLDHLGGPAQARE
jgi:hypothetical protein